MAVLQWAIVCERAIVEEQTNIVSLVSIVETINLPPPPPDFAKNGSVPLVPFRFFVVHQWARSNPRLGERIPGRLVLLGPNKQQFGVSEFVVDLTATPRARIIGQTIGFPLYGAGVYRCVVEAKVRTKWRKVGQAEFGVAFGAVSAPPRSRRH
jgi:hypothetical protein